MSNLIGACLDQFSFFHNANAALQAEMCLAADRKSFPAGQILYHEGDRVAAVAFVVRGHARIFKTSDSGSEITLYHVHDGQPCLMNLLSVVLCRNAMASAIALTPIDAVLFPVTAFRKWIEVEKSVRHFVLETLAHRTVEVMKLVEEVAFQKIDHRLAHVLLDRFRNYGVPLRVIRTTHDDLARELGTAREVVSRLLKELERRGAISLCRGQIEFKDERVLLQMMEEDLLENRKVAVV